MKKWICCLLAMLLLFAGCKKQAQPQTQPTQTPTEPEPTGLYDPNHPIEQLTTGAVRAYPLGGSGYTDMVTMGGKLLLAKEDGTGRVLYGDIGQVLAEGTLGVSSFDGFQVSAGPEGFALFQEQTNEVVIFNPQLQEVDRIVMPEQMQGQPVISMQTKEIFYCQSGEIRALNMENRTPRLLKQYTVAEQTLTGCYFEGTVISCEAVDEAGVSRTLFLSAADGSTLWENPAIETLSTYQDRYFVRRTDLTVPQTIVGVKDGAFESLIVPVEEDTVLLDVLALNGMLSYQVGESGLTLTFHDLSQKLTTAQLFMEGAAAPVSVVADEQFVWLIMQEQDGQVLYRWDVKASLLGETVAATAPLYTAAAPDQAGLEAVAQTLDGYYETYGVRVHFWDNASAYYGDYTVVQEHQPQIIADAMQTMEATLQLFPENFLRESVGTGSIRICFVRSVDGNQPWVQHWVGRDCVILISTTADVQKAFIESVGYAIDSRVLGHSRDYDTWNSLNPSGFRYSPKEVNTELLEGEKRAFVSQDAMKSPTEDRRTIFAAAMTADNQELFSSAIMQAKLKRMCEGIREAYGLEKQETIYMWETYLNEPLVKIDG